MCVVDRDSLILFTSNFAIIFSYRIALLNETSVLRHSGSYSLAFSEISLKKKISINDRRFQSVM